MPPTPSHRVEASKGDVYYYKDVSQEAYEAFLNAESIGSHHGKHIKQFAFDKFPAVPVPVPA